jgi:hypothetical protein
MVISPYWTRLLWLWVALPLRASRSSGERNLTAGRPARSADGQDCPLQKTSAPNRSGEIVYAKVGPLSIKNLTAPEKFLWEKFL